MKKNSYRNTVEMHPKTNLRIRNGGNIKTA